VGGAALLLPAWLAACSDGDGPISVSGSAFIDLRKEEGVLNYAYLVAHFQYEFYRYVTFAPYVGARTLEVVNQVTGVFARLQGHSQAQRQVFRNSISRDRIPDAMTFKFRTVNFTDRGSVFAFAQNMEDMGAQTYCTLLTLCRTPETLSILSKIASVEARHSAIVRDLIDINAGRSDTSERLSFASDALISPATGLENMRSVREYLDLMQQNTETRLTLAGA
jgi:hypothetical protein